MNQLIFEPKVFFRRPWEALGGPGRVWEGWEALGGPGKAREGPGRRAKSRRTPTTLTVFICNNLRASKKVKKKDRPLHFEWMIWVQIDVFNE